MLHIKASKSLDKVKVCNEKLKTFFCLTSESQIVTNEQKHLSINRSLKIYKVIKKTSLSSLELVRKKIVQFKHF